MQNYLIIILLLSLYANFISNLLITIQTTNKETLLAIIIIGTIEEYNLPNNKYKFIRGFRSYNIINFITGDQQTII